MDARSIYIGEGPRWKTQQKNQVRALILFILIRMISLFTGIQWQNTTSNPKDAIEPTFCGGLSWQGESFLVSFSDELGGSIGLGGEYNLNKAIAVRSGLQIPKDLPLRYWVGTSLDVANFRLDYVFQIDSNADMVSGLEHTLSVAFKI